MQQTLTGLAILSITVSALALGYTRWEYRKRGKLTLAGSLLLCAMLLVPNLILHYTATYELPATPIDYVGVAIGTIGLIICAAGIGAFRSIGKVFCLATPRLTQSGVYGWSRNPQYVGWVLFLLGFALNEWSLWSLLAVVLVALSLHLLVLIEEEHLRLRLGREYADFCEKTPRYFGL